MQTVANNFSERCKLKKSLNQRLKADGYWDPYNKLRDYLKRNGVSENIAWKVAAFQFPPRSGATAEIVADDMYAEIAAGWANDAYPLPDADSHAASTDNAVDNAGLKVPVGDTWKADWERLAAEVGSRSASELEEIRWVVANYLMPVQRIKPDDVPSSAALCILSWVQASSSNFGDFLRSNYVKIIPDKRDIEYQNRFQDTGQDLALIEEFEREFARTMEAAKAEAAQKMGAP
jgi:hypothetical protein